MLQGHCETGERMAYELEKLPYGYDALEPYIDAKTVEIHHDKHHQGYVNKLNAAVEKHPELFEKSVEDLLKDLDAIPEDIRTGVRNAGGGVANHNLYWKTMKKDGGEASGEIADAISKAFGSYDSFKEQFTKNATSLFGSGWTWLISNNGNLEIMNLPNQDSPLSIGKKPLLAIDVWEHAYYLKYQNRRPEYVENFLKVINWDYVNKLYSS